MDQLNIRLMEPSDLVFADALRTLAGWNQTAKDWQRFLCGEPQGCFLAEWGGAPAGTITTTCYSSALAWIGMLLVHPDFRQHGIGSGLLRHSLNHLQSRGVQSIKLDATPLGRHLYERCGFQPELTLTRWEARALPAIAPSAFPGVQPGTINDTPHIAAIDREAFGTLRQELLGQLASGCASVAVRRNPRGEITAFGMLREGARAFYLGPVAAGSAADGMAIIQYLLAGIPGRAVFWDVLDGNSAATAAAQTLGFTPQRHLLRMVRGENLVPGERERQYAIVDPAVG